VSDPATYRTKEEVKKFQDRDPILMLGEVLKTQKLAGDDQLKAWDVAARKRAEDDENWADESPPAKLEDAWTDVYAD